MKKVNLLFIFIVFISLNHTTFAWGGADFSGTWRSEYKFGPVEEIQTAYIQQIGEKILGSFSVEVKPSGDDYGGIIFGEVDDDEIEVYYISMRNQDEDDPVVAITFATGRLVGDTIQGKYYYQNSNTISLSGDFEATKI
jgi:hypothetical protein